MWESSYVNLLLWLLPIHDAVGHNAVRLLNSVKL